MRYSKTWWSACRVNFLKVRMTPTRMVLEMRSSMSGEEDEGRREKGRRGRGGGRRGGGRRGGGEGEEGKGRRGRGGGERMMRGGGRRGGGRRGGGEGEEKEHLCLSAACPNAKPLSSPNVGCLDQLKCTNTEA